MTDYLCLKQKEDGKTSHACNEIINHSEARNDYEAVIDTIYLPYKIDRFCAILLWTDPPALLWHNCHLTNDLDLVARSKWSRFSSK